MKKIISLILSLVMVLTLFAGLGVSAQNTTDGSVWVFSNTNTSKNVANVPMFGVNSTYAVGPGSSDPNSVVRFENSTDVAGIGNEGGILVDSDEYVGGMVTGGQGRYNVTVNPNIKINPANDLLVMYVKIPQIGMNSQPEFANRQWWDNCSIKWGNVVFTQGSASYTTDFSLASLKYLSKDGSAWQAGSFTQNTVTLGLNNLNGFEGYIMIDLSTVTVDATAWANFDWDADYSVKSITYENRCLGSTLGGFGIGGWYGVAVKAADTCTVAQLRGYNAAYGADELYGPDVNYNLSTFDPNPLVGTSTKSFGNVGATSTAGTVWNVGFATSTTYPEKYDSEVRTINALSNCINKTNAIELYADTTSGYYTDQKVHFYSNIGTSPSDGVKTGMLYLELPKTGLGYNSIIIDQVVYDGYAAWQNFSNTEFQYLPIDGAAWITSTVGSNKEFILPDGFKGYVKLPFNNDTHTVWKIEFLIGMYGGDYGSAYIGGIFDLSVDNDSVYMSLGGAASQKLAEPTDVSPIVGTMQNVKNDNALIGTNSAGDFAVTTDAEYTAVYTANSEEIGTQLMRTLSITNAAGSANGTKVAVKLAPNLTIDPKVNTVMAWMEFPTTPDGSDLKVKMENPSFQQNNAWYWTNSYGMQYSYLANNSTRWVNGQISTDGNKTFTIPSGFKGYVKFHFDTCANYVNDWSNPTNGTYASRPFDYDAAYIFTDFTFEFPYIGGSHGDFTFGTWSVLAYDSNSLYATITNSDTANGEPESICAYSNMNMVNLNQLIANITEIGDVAIEDAELVEETIALYAALTDEYKAMLTEEQAAAYADMVAAFADYRPAFKGVAGFIPNGDGYAGMKVGTTLDASAAIADGYYVAEYGTVALRENNYSALRPDFDAESTGAIVESKTNEDAANSGFAWDYTFKSNNAAEFGVDYYFRAYVTYTNGTDSYTIWNGNYTNSTLRTYNEVLPENETKAGRLPIQTIVTSDPYLVTSLAGVANKFGYSIMGGSSVGNVDGKFELALNSDGWSYHVEESITASDLVATRKHLLGVDELKYWYTADMNGDGSVNIRDLVKLKKSIAE